MSKFNLKNSAAIAGMVLLLGSSAAMADTIYSSIPAPFPSALPSLGYQATSTSEFGDKVHFAGTARDLTSVTVSLSDWAKYSTYANDPRYSGNTTSFSLPMTLNLYNLGTGNSVGSLIASVTAVQDILWRPEVFASGGLAQNVSFDFTNAGIGTVVPDDVVFGLVFDTQSYGPNPIGVDGPYNSLNFALNNIDAAPSVGTTDTDALYWNTSFHGFYTSYDPTATAFQQDTGWTGYIPSVQFDAVVPEPSTLALFGAALLGLGFFAVRRRKTGAAV